LSWTNPAPIVETDDLTIAVKFEQEASGVYDPNWGAANAIPVTTSTAGGTNLESAVLLAMSPSVGTLADDTLWSWQVTVTDPNTGGTPVETAGDVWLFEVGDALPIIDTVVEQYMWLDQDDSAIGTFADTDPNVRYFEVITSYTDDGKSTITDANHTTTDWLWDNDEAGAIEVSDVWTADAVGANGEKSGTVTAIYRTVAPGEDPLRPDGTNIPGWWNLGLEVSDVAGARMTQGGTGINRVDYTCGEAAAAGGDEDFEGKYDVNNDCRNDLVDFEALAAKWLSQSDKFE
jgi:hypothetical protein